MATSTTNYSFTLPEVGGDTDQWGTQLNANWTLADTTLKTIADSVGDDVTLVGNDYLSISGQAITVGDVDLTTDVTGTLPVGSGGTGLAALGTANQVLAVNSTADGLEFQTVSGSGTVTSVTVSGSDGIEVDSGSPITSSGTITLGINSTSLSTHLGLGSLATQSTITESQISDLGSYITASSTDTLTNKSGNISQWTNDSGYLTAETNDLSNVSGTLGTGNGGTGLSAIGTANQVLAVNSGANALEFQTISITESQISDLQSYLTAEVNDLSAAVTWANVPDANITQSSVTQHQAALSITESQISDLGSYQTSDAGLTSIAGLTTAADKMLYTTAADTYAVTTLTTAGRALLDDADAAAQRTTLGLGSLATQSTITESQISDLQSYLTAEVNDLSAAVTGTLGTGNGGTGLTSIGTAGQVLKVNSAGNALEYATSSLPVVDAAGTNVLSESGGTVTLTADEANVGSNALVVDSSGKVGIGTSSPATKFDVASGNITISNSTNAPYINFVDNTTRSQSLSRITMDQISGTAGQLLFSTTTGGTLSEALRIDSSGNVNINNLGSGDVYATSGTLYISSDIRLKNDLGVIDESAIEIIKQLTPRYYSWKDDESSRQQLGFFAQEVFPILPEAVPRDLKYEQNGVDENGEPILEQVLDDNGEPDYQWGFATQPIVAMCVKAIQEQQTLIESQQSQIDALTARIEALETS